LITLQSYTEKHVEKHNLARFTKQFKKQLEFAFGKQKLITNYKGKQPQSFR